MWSRNYLFVLVISRQDNKMVSWKSWHVSYFLNPDMLIWNIPYPLSTPRCAVQFFLDGSWLYHMWCFAHFGTMCTIWKLWKTTMKECYLKYSEACNFTKSNSPSWVFFVYVLIAQMVSSSKASKVSHINI